MQQENISAEMSPVARQANAGNLGGRIPWKNSLESPLGPGASKRLQIDLFSGGLPSPRHGSVMGK